MSVVKVSQGHADTNFHIGTASLSWLMAKMSTTSKET
jgi:hypothetical protein